MSNTLAPLRFGQIYIKALSVDSKPSSYESYLYVNAIVTGPDRKNLQGLTLDDKPDEVEFSIRRASRDNDLYLKQATKSNNREFRPIYDKAELARVLKFFAKALPSVHTSKVNEFFSRLEGASGLQMMPIKRTIESQAPVLTRLSQYNDGGYFDRTIQLDAKTEGMQERFSDIYPSDMMSRDQRKNGEIFLTFRELKWTKKTEYRIGVNWESSWLTKKQVEQIRQLLSELPLTKEDKSTLNAWLGKTTFYEGSDLHQKALREQKASKQASS